LAGVRVVEVVGWTFVPGAGAINADLGGDVIKVEPPEATCMATSGCTPGRFKNEGRPDEKSRVNAAFGGGPVAFFDLLDEWRRTGGLGGLELLG
jgi:hypothetical protein